MSQYCKNCGGELELGSVFCEQCGTKISKEAISDKVVSTEYGTPATKVDYTQEESTKSGIPPSSVTQTKPVFVSGKHAQTQRKTGGLSRGVITAIILVVIMVFCVSLAGFFVFGNWAFDNYVYIGDKPLYVSSTGNYTEINFNLDNSIGKINIDTVTGQSSPVTTRVRVSAIDDYEHRLTDANSITEQTTNESLSVSFTSDWNNGRSMWSRNPFKYELTVNIVKSYDYTFNLGTSTGDISLSVRDATIEGLDISVTTGDIEIILNNVTISSSSVSAQSTTGDMNLDFTNLIFNQNTEWDLILTTGNIDLDFTQDLISSSLITQTFSIETTTGSINVNSIFNTQLGLKITADTTTGNIEIFDQDYDDSVTEIDDEFPNPITFLKFDFSLRATTGHINFD
ncbi:MAG: DUF4097 family beta strand repeat-containing protein [Candidatus Hodarchaeales archaeon]|jgi:hypothetical protein